MWTAQNQRKGFMAITAHWIDDCWKLQSRVIRFVYVSSPHIGEVIAGVLMDCVAKWGIDRKLSALTLDNCSTNDALVNVLLTKLDKKNLIMRGMFFHIRCCAHIINLIVQDGLDVIGDAIEKVRDSIAFWRGTPKREQKFAEQCKLNDISYNKKLVLDCKTRWNSTYVMLSIALIYRDVFPSLKHSNRSFKCCPTDEEWDMAAYICSKLEIFYRVTELFSGTAYPTINVCFRNLCDIKTSLDIWVHDSRDVIRNMATRMRIKFDKYWAEIQGIFAVALILDPRYKMVALKAAWATIYGGTVVDELEKVKKILYDLFDEYDEKSRKEISLGANDQSEISSSSCTQSHSTSTNFDKMFDTYMLQIEQESQSIKSDLDTYLGEVNVPRTEDFDILFWWKTYGPRYPTLQAIVRDIYVIPISTVASESAFSTGGRIIAPHRNRLASNRIEALMCCRDWLWASLEEEDKSSTISRGHRALNGDDMLNVNDVEDDQLEVVDFIEE